MQIQNLDCSKVYSLTLANKKFIIRNRKCLLDFFRARDKLWEKISKLKISHRKKLERLYGK